MPPKIHLKLSYPRLISRRAPKFILISLGLLLLGMFIPAFSNPGTVVSFQKISDTQGGFLGSLANNDNFGIAVAEIGNLDGDGIPDLAVGARHDDDGGPDRGAVWILFMNSDGTVKAHQKISNTAGGFTGVLDDGDEFGFAISGLGDLDGDTVPDLAVGAHYDDDGGTDRGAVWILFMNSDGTVKAHQKISNTMGNFTGGLDNGDFFGTSVAGLDDLDGDTVRDLAVGASYDDDGGTDRGAIWILFMNSDGTVKGQQKISDTAGGFTGVLDNTDYFANVIAALEDLDGDTVPDLAVGAYLDDDGGTDRGAVWVLFMNADGTVKAHQKISSTAGGFTGTLDNSDYFGVSVTALDDLDDDTVPDLAVGAYHDDDGGPDKGAVWMLFMNPNGTVKGYQKISDTQGGFNNNLDNGDAFGYSLITLNDLNGDGVQELVVGATGDDDGGAQRGAVWILFLDAAPEIDVLDNGISIPDDTGMVSFGTTVVGAPITKTFTVYNSGVGNLTLTPPITLPVGYSLVNNFGTTTVIPTSSTTFEVQLDATTAGIFSGTLAFDNNDLDENPYNFVISGTVLALIPGYGSVPAVGSTINVGTSEIGNTINTTLNVQETGNSTLDVGEPGGGMLSGANAGDFNIINGPPFSIVDGGADQMVTIQCTPSEVGLRTATLSFTTNDPTQPTVSYTLNCTGTVTPTPAPSPPDSDDDDDAPAPPPISDQIIDCWPWQVIVPSQAVPDASIHCVPSLGAPLPAPSTFEYQNHSAEITVNDAGGTPVSKFNPPIKICFRYTQTELSAVDGNPANFLLQTYYNERWESLPTAPESDPSPLLMGRVCVLVDHLTLFAVFENRPSGDTQEDNPLTEVKYLPETGVSPINSWLNVIRGAIVVLIALTLGFGWLLWQRRRYD